MSDEKAWPTTVEIRTYGALDAARVATAKIEDLFDIGDPVGDDFDKFQEGVESAQRKLMDAWGRLYHVATELKEC